MTNKVDKGDCAECLICSEPSSTFIPKALRGCGHSFCPDCVSSLKKVDDDGIEFFKCPICRRISSSSHITNYSCWIFSIVRTIPRCPECHELFGPQRHPYFIRSSGRWKHDCSHAYCLPCYKRLWKEKQLFCRICVIQLPVPKVCCPPKNYMLMDAIEAAYGEIGPEEEAEMRKIADERDEAAFNEYLGDIKVVVVILAERKSVSWVVGAYNEMVQKLEYLNNMGFISLKDKMTMLSGKQRLDAVDDTNCKTSEEFHLALNLLFLQARIEGFSQMKTVKGVKGWTRLSWNKYWTMPEDDDEDEDDTDADATENAGTDADGDHSANN